MVISWLLLDLASLPKAESRPLEILLLPSALTLLSDIVSVPWDTDMASWALGQNEFGWAQTLHGENTRTFFIVSVSLRSGGGAAPRG